jgi:hypothetical protein
LKEMDNAIANLYEAKILGGCQERAL